MPYIKNVLNLQNRVERKVNRVRKVGEGGGDNGADCVCVCHIEGGY